MEIGIPKIKNFWFKRENIMEIVPAAVQDDGTVPDVEPPVSTKSPSAADGHDFPRKASKDSQPGERDKFWESSLELIMC